MAKKYSSLTLIRGLADKQVQPSLKCTEINAYRKIALSYLSCSSSTVPGRGCTAMWIAGMMLIKEIRKLYNIDINAEYFFFDDRKTAMNVDDLSRGKNIRLKKVGVQSPVGAKRHQGLGHSNPTDIVKQKDRGDETVQNVKNWISKKAYSSRRQGKKKDYGSLATVLLGVTEHYVTYYWRSADCDKAW